MAELAVEGVSLGRRFVAAIVAHDWDGVGLERSRMHLDPALLQLRLGAATELVGCKRGEEEHGVGELRKLHRRNRASAGGLDPRISR